MAYCPNKNLEEWKLLVSSRGEDIAYYLWDKYEGNVPEIESKQSIVKAGLKAIQILNSDKAKQIFDKGNKNNWSLEKILAELAVPREQRELIKGLGKTNLNEIVTDLLANYSYTIEINTAKEKPVKQLSLDSPESFIDDFGNEYTRDYSDTHEGFDYFKNGNLITKQQFDKEYQDSLDDVVENQNTQYYSNLTVPGGTNYTENEIATPAITPSIKGHAQFATDQGIGWFRSDDKIADKLKTTLGKELEYKDPYIPQSRLKSFKQYEVLNESGDNIGTVVVEYRGNKTVILHPKLNVTGKGYGKDLYKLISSKFNVEVQEWSEGAIANSDSAKKMWDSLEKEGSAKRIIDVEQGDNFRVLNYNIDTSKTRRILEVQSDLFQKGRDKEKLTEIEESPLGDYNTLEELKTALKNGSINKELYSIKKERLLNNINSSKNQFLQLLNKDNNWVTFFVKSIIQSTAKEIIQEINEQDVENMVKSLQREGKLKIKCD